MAACTVCQCVCVSNFSTVRFFVLFISFLTQGWIGFVWGMLIPYNVLNIMRMSRLGSKVIKEVLLDET